MAAVIPFKQLEVKSYLDRCIRYWRGKKAGGDLDAECYIDAYQSVRRTLFGETLPLDTTEPPDDLQEGPSVTAVTDVETAHWIGNNPLIGSCTEGQLRK